MAEIPKIESGRVGVNAPRSAVTPNVVYPQLTPEIALIQQAKYQGTLADKLDRMSAMIYKDAGDLSAKAGLQFAAENPLTKDQLNAMVKGDMSGVALGSPMNVFDSALRKVRAFELSAHAEGEATTKLLDVYQKAEMGELDFAGVQNQVKAITDGYGRSLAEVDPESSFKYRASLATMGNRVIDETAKLESKKRMLANGIKTERMYQDFKRMSEIIYNGESMTDPTTGQPISKDDLVDSLAQNFMNNAIAMVGITGAGQYQQNILKDLTDSKVNTLSKYLADGFGSEADAFNRMKSGDMGRLTDLWQTLGEDAKAKVYQTYFTKISTDNNIKDQQDKANRVDREMQAVALYDQISKTSDPVKKKALLRQMSELKVFSFEEINKLSRGEGESNQMAMFNAINGIYNGTINNADQIRALPINTKDKINLLNKLHSETKAEDRELDSGLRRLAGIPSGLVALDPKGQEFERLRKYQADAQVLKADALREGKILTNSQVLDQLGKKVEEKRNTEAAKAARTSLKAYEEKAGGEITSQTLPAFEAKVKAGKVPGVKENQLPRIRQLVQQAEGGM